VRVAATVAACAGLLATAAPALAADRFASPDGTGPEPCTAAARCGLLTAVNDAAANDRVFLAPGDYGSPSQRILGQLNNGGQRIEIVGELRQVAGVLQRPVIYIANDSGVAVELTGDGGEISDVTIDSDSTLGAFGSTPLAGSTALERVLIRERGGFAACLFSNPQPQIMSSSACLAEAANGVAIQVQGSLEMHNATAVATGADSVGLSYLNAASTTAVSATNSILRGAGDADIETVDSGASTTLTLVNSNYATLDNLNGATVVDETGKQAAAPLLADPANGNLRQVEGSPTVDAGVASPGSGNFDLDAGARVQRAATDIGAYELAPAPPPVVIADPPAPPAPPRIISVRISRIAPAAKRVRVNRAGRLAVRLACRGGGTRCRGLLALTAKTRPRGERAKIEVVLVRKRFEVAANRTGRIALRLGPGARRLLAAARRGKLATELRLTSGGDEATSRLTLLAPPKRKPSKPRSRSTR
jgi:hypothetical protein